MPKQKINQLSSVELDMIVRPFGMKGGTLMKDRMRDYPVNKLKPHPKNESIYGSEDIEDLVEQIQAYGGIVDPLKIKEDGTIISGHRRWKAAQKLGMEKVPCEILTYDSEEEELAALVLFNYHRVKTNEQRAREGMALEEALRADGMIRKLSNLKQNMTERDPGTHTEASDGDCSSSEAEDKSGEKGRTRDKVADAVKIGSGKNYERMKSVILAVDQLRLEGKLDDANFLIKILNKSVRPASNLVSVGFTSFPNEERSRIRSGEVTVSQALKTHREANSGTGHARSNPSVKKVLQTIEAMELELSKILPAIDSPDDDTLPKLKDAVARLQSTLSDVEKILGQGTPDNK